MQRLIATGVVLLGVLLSISETPVEQGLISQIWLTGGGILLIFLAIAWLYLISKEEEAWVTRS